MKKILCYGDSNTFGYKPDRTGRFDESIRWPALLAKSLGADFNIIENGVCGRTTALDDPFVSGRNGLAEINDVMKKYAPVDLVILMLGTNDLKTFYEMTAASITENCGRVIDRILNPAYGRNEVPKVLLISPILLGENILAVKADYNQASVDASQSLAAEYEALAKEKSCYFLRAEDFAKPSPLDCEHMNESNHKKLALAIEDTVKKVFSV